LLTSLQDLIVNLIASAISFLLGVFLPNLWTRITKHKRFRALCKLWTGIEGEVLFVTCVHAGSAPDGEEAEPKYLGFGDASAMKSILELLTSSWLAKGPISIREYYEGRLLPEDRENNLVCIGGGVANQVTTEMLYAIGVPRHFFDKAGGLEPPESKVVRNSDGTWSVRPVVVDGKVIEDIGIIVKSKHPFYPEKTVIILAGAYSYGTLAAARFAVSESLLRQCEPILDSERFEIVIKAKMDGFNVSGITVEWASRF
jgi:hypothetical protein